MTEEIVWFLFLLFVLLVQAYVFIVYPTIKLLRKGKK